MKRRITVLIDEDIYDRLQSEIRHGFRSPLVAGVLKLALNSIQSDGEMMVGAIISGQYRLVPISEEVA